MSSSLDANSPRMPSELDRDGEAFYDSRLKSTLEPQHSGEFVAIEPSTGQYFLGPTATAALVTARNAMPQSQFFLTRIGQHSAQKIRGTARTAEFADAIIAKMK
jgi:hypothetical protein